MRKKDAAARTRILTIRLSQDEYEILGSVSQMAGARSLSEFARASILHKIQADSATEYFLSEDLLDLAARLQKLDRSLRDVHGRVKQVMERSFEDEIQASGSATTGGADGRTRIPGSAKD